MSLVSNAWARSQAFSLVFEILFERHVGVLRAVLDVGQFDFAQRRADRRDVQPYSFSRCRIFWISGIVSCMTFFTPEPTSMKRRL